MRLTRICAHLGRLAPIVFATLFGLAPAAFAQQMPAQAEPSAAMKKLGAMQGVWTGESWANTPSGRVRISSWENVESKLGGLVLFVEGRHTSIEKADSGRVVHHAAAMLYWDNATQKVVFHPVTFDGRTTTTWTELTDKGMNWGFDLPNNYGKVKYEVDLSTPGVWIENGFYSRDGVQWLPTMGLNLKKVK